jgi:hypothetical protein
MLISINFEKVQKKTSKRSVLYQKLLRQVDRGHYPPIVPNHA